MNAVLAQEIERSGFSAVDELIGKGDLHITCNNQPQYVVLSEARYRELVAEAHEAYLARVRESLEDAREGRVRKFAKVEDLLKALDADEPA